jgi:hypothetical protein
MEQGTIHVLIRSLHEPLRRFYSTLITSAPATNSITDLLAYFDLFTYHDPILAARIAECGLLCGINVLQALPLFLRAFPRISLKPGSPPPDRIVPGSPFALIWPLYTDTPSRRRCLYYLSNWVLSEFFRVLFEKADPAHPQNLAHAWGQLLILFLNDSDERNDNSPNSMKVFFAARWSIVVNLVSRSLPSNVANDLLKILANFSSYQMNMQFFFLRAFSQIRLGVFDENLRSGLIQFLNLAPPRSGPMLSFLIEFARNIAGFAILEGGPFADEVEAILQRISKPTDPFVSTLVLFATLRQRSGDIAPLLFPQSPAASRVPDILGAFVTVLNGKNYLPKCDASPDWKPNEAHRDKLPQCLIGFSKIRQNLLIFKRSFRIFLSAPLKWIR